MIELKRRLLPEAAFFCLSPFSISVRVRTGHNRPISFSHDLSADSHAYGWTLSDHS
jgi:hypothetical protein